MLRHRIAPFHDVEMRKHGAEERDQALEHLDDDRAARDLGGEPAELDDIAGALLAVDVEYAPLERIARPAGAGDVRAPVAVLELDRLPAGLVERPALRVFAEREQEER